MSNLETIGLILVAFIGGGALLTFLSEVLNKQAGVILTGLSDGVPVSLELRRVMLYRVYLQYLGGVIATSVVLALASVRIAENVHDPDIKTLAYISAFFAGFVACSWAILGTWTGVDCARAIREASRQSRGGPGP